MLIRLPGRLHGGKTQVIQAVPGGKNRRLSTMEGSFFFFLIRYLIRMHHQRGLSVELLHLIRSHQVSHAHGPPASLALPQHCVQSREQSSDVPLLSLDPVQDLALSKRPTLSQTEHCVVHVLILFFFFIFSFTCNFSGSISLVISCLLISAMVLGPFLSFLDAKP